MGHGAEEDSRQRGRAISRKIPVQAAPGLSFPSYSHGQAELEGWGLSREAVSCWESRGSIAAITKRCDLGTETTQKVRSGTQPLEEGGQDKARTSTRGRLRWGSTTNVPGTAGNLRKDNTAHAMHHKPRVEQTITRQGKDRSVSWLNHFGSQVGLCLVKLNTHRPSVKPGHFQGYTLQKREC